MLVRQGGRGRSLYDEIKSSVLDGTYLAGTALPSSRACAAERGLSRSTVSSVYEQLAAEGFVEMRQGAGTRVAAGAAVAGAARPKGAKGARRPRVDPALSSIGRRLESLALPVRSASAPEVVDFVYGPLAGRDFPTLAWTKAARQVERQRAPVLAYEDPQGNEELRAALRVHLAHARGVFCDTSQLLVVNGSQQALDLCARLLVEPGDTVAVENPGYRMAHHVFECAGATLRGVAVDPQGLVPADLAHVPDARLIYVTPTHQFPMGGLMTIRRRNALLEWAAEKGAWIVEDDYDSEYRHAARPEAALQALDDRGLVIYVGTFSKTLSPQLRLGYMVLPHRLVAAFATAKRVADRHAPSAPQRTLARLLKSGAYDRHVRRLRRSQKARREALLAALGHYLQGQVSVHGASSGLHLVVAFDDLPSALEEELARLALLEGVQAYPLGRFYLPAPSASAAGRPAALVLGYASLEPERMDPGVQRIARALHRLRDRRTKGA
ncbi:MULTISPECIES: PLP-dependent aminotransferase family protein [unclassified Variovorax]|uniref:MocR-like pyridoxine biosynthesis transcription factor PdxR n=1 Tax=unclassified Variovorax TaxID=663243 RepID=UPI002575BE1C|nr:MULTISPECIES: PLP-dependent aminotransferase family protein [unclassified Variovorax]MDM0087242.1 PLP-dependent aminotransferase family protein [Variovorax sp. J22G40]MDM0144501.1 PLP-dependent aminotransferase family protein [Variovorax sp. J2P1-31]